jgi:predicted SnoaL-like aldol condensation-catalyzing enzyme
MRPIPVALVAGFLAFATPATAGDTAQEEANKKVVLEFYDRALNQKDFEGAAKHFGPRYIQHNPLAADGIEGFKKFIEFRSQRFPNARNEIKRALADGDLVMVHAHSIREPGERGSAIVDIFRLENGRIVEHWDVIQPVPEKANNDNGMF